MSKYTTGEIAKLCGVSVRTVQYYDTRGILVPSDLTEGGRRLYSESDLSQMKIICFLRELDLPLDSIRSLMKEENSTDVIALILEEQERILREELEEKQEKLTKLENLRRTIQRSDDFSLQSIGDVAHMMKNKQEMKKLHATLLVTGIPLAVVQWSAIVLWITTGIWWPFLVYAVAAVPYGIWVSRYYFRRVAYICPRCHEVFVPTFKAAFWASHTPTTRKLTCPHCGQKSFCVETYRKENETLG